MLLSQYWSLLKVNNMRELRGVGKGLTVWCMAGFWVSSKAKSKPVKQYRHVNGSSLCDTNTQTEQWKISFCFYTTFLWRLSPSSPPPPICQLQLWLCGFFVSSVQRKPAHICFCSKRATFFQDMKLGTDFVILLKLAVWLMITEGPTFPSYHFSFHSIINRLLNTFKVPNINEIYFKYLCTDMKQTFFKREKKRSTNSSTSAAVVNKEKPLINKTKMHFTVSLINIKSWDYQKIQLCDNNIKMGTFIKHLDVNIKKITNSLDSLLITDRFDFSVMSKCN